MCALYVHINVCNSTAAFASETGYVCIGGAVEELRSVRAFNICIPHNKMNSIGGP